METREDEKRGTREERSIMVKRGWGQSKSIVAFLHFCRSLRCHCGRGRWCRASVTVT